MLSLTLDVLFGIIIKIVCKRFLDSGMTSEQVVERMDVRMKKTAVILFIIMGCICLSSCSEQIELLGNENSESISYNGISYDREYFYCADDDRKLIGHIENGANVYSIGTADPPQFILVVGSDNSGCFIADGSFVPTTGTITKVLIDPGIRSSNSRYLSKDNELSVLAEITEVTGEPQEFLIDNYYTDGNAFYYVYNNSDVSCEENYGGYIAYTNGKWIYSAPGETIEWKENNTVLVTGIVIENDELIKKIRKTDIVKYISQIK